jgi:hypothetical protein
VAKPPTDLLPLDGLTVASPPAFSWTPGAGTGGIYLNVSTDSTFKKIDVLNWKDDGTHYKRGSIDFQNLKGIKLYWRIVYDSIPTPVRSFTVGENSIDPHYTIIHIGWPGGTWDPHEPRDLSSIQDSLLLDIKSKIGSLGNTPDKKIGFSFHIPYFFINGIAHYKLLLDKICQVSERTEMPILFGLDGFAWWRGRPDLWNWWNSALPGYDPNNINNVEWTSWDSKDAVREGWRNWGSAFQLDEPQPNLTSKAVINANQDALKELVPVIKSWHQGLPSDRKYLFAGIKLGWEVGIGSQYFYPKDGDTSSSDKGTQIGYAAVKTAGLAVSGQLKRSDITRCAQIYLTELAKTIYFEGIPRQKIFTHAGAYPIDSKYPIDSTTTIQYITPDAALNPFANPGWSFYSGDNGPQGLGSLDLTLNKVDSIWWANSEWGGAGKWEETLLKFETYRNNKIINSFAGYDSSAFRKLVDLPPRINSRSHWLNPPVLRSKVQGNTATLFWDSPSQAQELYLNVTTQPDFTDSGLFKSITVINERVSQSNVKVLGSLSPGNYYWIVVADGHGRRVISDINMFVI